MVVRLPVALLAGLLLAGCRVGNDAARIDVAAPSAEVVDASPDPGPTDAWQSEGSRPDPGPPPPDTPSPEPEGGASEPCSEPAGDASAETEPVPVEPAEVVEAAADAPTGVFPPPAPVGCVTSVAAGHHVFPCQGLDVDVHVPGACLASPCGLILDIHGLTMNAKQQDNNTNLRALGEAHGYVVIQPNAKDPPPFAKWVTHEDDAKVWALALDVAAAWHTDPLRFHATGFSQGGFMTWRLLCQHADVLASVAPASSCDAYGFDLPYVGPLAEVGCSFDQAGHPAQEIPVLQIHGTLDPIIPYFCGNNMRNILSSAWHLEEQETVSSDGDHAWTRSVSPSGTVVEFIAHNYRSKSVILQGHCLPGSADLDGAEPGQLLGGFGCRDESPVTWGEAVIRFFMAHPRPGHSTAR